MLINSTTTTFPYSYPSVSTLDFSKTFGALFVGVIISTVLYGITCTQTWYYLSNYSDDLLVKSLVVFLFVLETVHSISGTHAVYTFLVINYNNPMGLLKATWSVHFTVAVTAFIMLIVQLYYAKRVYHLSQKNILLAGLLVLLIFTHFGLSIYVTIKCIQLQYFDLIDRTNHIMDAVLSVTVATDVLIGASLSYYLHRSRTGFRSTNTLINKLMIYSINNGILTSMFDIIVLVIMNTEHNFIFLAIYQVVGNLYTNSMLGILNSRKTTVQNLPIAILPTAFQFSGVSTQMLSEGGTINRTENSMDNESSDYHVNSSNVNNKEPQEENLLAFKIFKTTATRVVDR